MVTSAPSEGNEGDGAAQGGHLQCPECGGYNVQRLYLATIHSDSCSCDGCGAAWDEDCATGTVRPRGRRSSALLRSDL